MSTRPAICPSSHDALARRAVCRHRSLNELMGNAGLLRALAFWDGLGARLRRCPSGLAAPESIHRSASSRCSSPVTSHASIASTMARISDRISPGCRASGALSSVEVSEREAHPSNRGLEAQISEDPVGSVVEGPRTWLDPPSSPLGGPIDDGLTQRPTDPHIARRRFHHHLVEFHGRHPVLQRCIRSIILRCHRVADQAPAASASATKTLVVGDRSHSSTVGNEPASGALNQSGRSRW